MSRDTRRALRRLYLRSRAIFCCLWFGLLPWWVYENTPHCSCPWWEHLKLNLADARMWLENRQSFGDWRFELRVNSRPNWIRGVGCAITVNPAGWGET